MLEALDGLDRGLSIDPDAATMGKQEALVEDLIEKLEDINTVDIPTKDPRLLGAWQLMYTSSSITRFFGGVTGVQRLLPEGEIGRIVQFIDLENGTSRFTEQVSYELPIVGKTVTSEAVVEGKIRPSSAVRLLWDAERVKMSWFSWFADGWKTMRAFRISDITYLDDNLRITRGQTGSVNVFARLEKD